jgi:hypothetical protein
VKEFYKLLEATEAKVHEDTDVTILQAVTRLMAMKSKYNFSNNCYNDIVKLIIDLIPSNHNMLKDLYHCKKIVAGLGMNYKRLMLAKITACCSRRSMRKPHIASTTVSQDMQWC